MAAWAGVSNVGIVSISQPRAEIGSSQRLQTRMCHVKILISSSAFSQSPSPSRRVATIV